MIRILSAALAAAVPVLAVSAQTRGVFPPQYKEIANANTYDSLFPFSWAAPQRSMMVIDPEIVFHGSPLGIGVPVPDGKQITKIGFRKEPTLDSEARKVFLQIWMAKPHGGINSANASGTFASNFASGTEVKVYDGLLDLPALNNASPEVWVTLQTPYTYDASAGLVIDFRVTLNSFANQTFNYYLDLAQNEVISLTDTFGAPCQGSAGNTPNHSLNPTAVGGQMGMNLSGATASSLAAFQLNVEKLAVPITAPAVAGPCQLAVLPLAIVGGMTNSGGGLSLSVGVPNDLTLFGLTLFSQAVIPDFFANTLGAISSNGAQVTFGAQPRSTIIRQQGDALAPTGGIGRNWGYITLFEWLN